MNIITSPRIKERKEANTALSKIFVDKAKCFVIHYSCESFANLNGKSPRINSICISNLKSEQSDAFSLHIEAQKNPKFSTIDIKNLTDDNLNEIEKSLLQSFSKFVKSKKNSKWIHWNMKTPNFGFSAINTRLELYKLPTLDISDDDKYNLAKILIQNYSKEYCGKTENDKLIEIAKINKIRIDNVLTGLEEVNNFNNKNYLTLHTSTLNKVNIMYKILISIEYNTLKVKANKFKIYGLQFSGITAIVKDSPWLNFIVSAIIGALISKGIENMLSKIK